jgi:hypothetical protein
MSKLDESTQNHVTQHLINVGYNPDDFIFEESINYNFLNIRAKIIARRKSTQKEISYLCRPGSNWIEEFILDVVNLEFD